MLRNYEHHYPLLYKENYNGKRTWQQPHEIAIADCRPALNSKSFLRHDIPENPRIHSNLLLIFFEIARIIRIANLLLIFFEIARIIRISNHLLEHSSWLCI